MSDIVAKVMGADFELANLMYTPGVSVSRPTAAADRLLAELPGYPQRRYKHGTVIELNRRFLAGSGGSAYIDSDHLEMNTAEHVRARDHAAHVHAALRMARRAQLSASLDLPPRTRLCVLANNCDGHVSYGRHLNMLTTSRCFNDILYRKPHLGGVLATHLVTSVVYSGQGLVGAANDRPACDYQLSQRADWFERFSSTDTMQRRPLLNLRDEPHAANGLARQHIIYYDTVLAPMANFLQAGTTQLILAMCEAGRADPRLQLDDAVGAASEISRDLSLRQKLPTAVPGVSATAVEIQQQLAEQAGEFVDTGAVDEAVPDAREIVVQWQSTLELLRERDVEALARRCDNWLKYLLLDRQRGRRGVAWQSDAMRMLDMQFSSLDPADGLFFQMAEAGVIEQMPDDARIDRFVDDPPDETRAYLRAQVLRRFGEAVYQMDWSWIDFRIPGSRGWWSTASIPMPDPRCHTRQECEATLTDCRSLDDLVHAFGGSGERDRASVL
jgi:proteasome accessory factor A